MPVLLAILIIAFYWKLTFTTQYTWLASPDLSHMVLPWFQFETREWHHLRFPLWDPYAWAGHPFLAQAQPGAAYPLNWLLFLLPFDHGWMCWTVMNWYFVGMRVLAGLAFYWLCRDLDRSRLAALAGSLTYAIGGYVASVEWPQMVNGVVWVPLVFLFQLRSARGVRPMASAILSGFFLGLTWLCGHHQMPLFVTLGSALLWLYIVARTGRLRIVAALGVAVLVSGFQTLPTAEYGRLARRWAAYGDPLKWNDRVPYPVHSDFSMNPLSVWSIAVPGTDHNIVPFVGIAALVLAVIGLIRGWRFLSVRCLGAVALGGLLFALGPSSVFHGILYSLMPMVEKARVPAQAIILFHVGVCALAAYGFDEFVNLSRRASARIAAVLLVIAAALSLGGLYLFEARVLAMNGDTRFMVTALACVFAAGVLLAASRRALGVTAAGVLMLAVIVWENGNVTGYFWSHVDNKERMADLRQLNGDHDIRMFLQAQAGSPRVAYDQEVVPHNIGHWWGLETFDAYQASVPDLLWRREPFHPRTRGLLGVRYYIGKKPLNPDETEVFRAASGKIVYQFPAWMPRVWAVHRAEQVSDEQATRMLTDASVDLSTRTFSTMKPPVLEACSGDTVEMKSHMANTVRIEASMACRGLVILDDQYFPGWKATVDGKSVSILDAYGLVRGVAVEAGKHTVEFQYRPLSVYLGAAMTLLGCAAAFVAARSKAA